MKTKKNNYILLIFLVSNL